VEEEVLLDTGARPETGEELRSNSSTSNRFKPRVGEEPEGFFDAAHVFKNFLWDRHISREFLHPPGSISRGLPKNIRGSPCILTAIESLRDTRCHMPADNRPVRVCWSILHRIRSRGN